MFRNFSLRTKLLVPIFGLLALALPFMIFIIYRQLSGVTTDFAYRVTANISAELGARVEGSVQAGLVTARASAAAFSALAAVGARSRDLADAQASAILAASPESLGLNIAWEPGAFDKADARALGRADSDGSGRLAFRLAREGDGIQLSAIEYVDSQAWYSSARSARSLRLSEPTGRDLTDSTNLSVFCVAPLLGKGATTEAPFLGALAVELDLAAVKKIVAEAKPLGTGVAALYSNEGLVVAHADPARVGSSLRQTEADILGDRVEELVSAVATGERLAWVARSELFKSPALVSVSPVYFGGIETPWSVAVAVPLTSVLSAQRSLLLFMVAIGAATLALLLAIVFFLAAAVTKPIRRTAEILADVAEGEGDLSHRLPASGRDEIGNMARNFNAFMERLQGIVSSLRASGESLETTGIELAESMEETAAAVAQIAGNARGVSELADSQSAAVDASAREVERMATTVSGLDGRIEGQAGGIAEASSSVEQMVANVASVGRSIGRLGASFETLLSASESGRSSLSALNERIREMAGQSQSLLETNQVIASVASQTNLLAMNAAIEAAHAGEAGRGFSVVADEIRALAEKSAARAKDTAKELKGIKATIDSMVGSSAGAEAEFGSILGIIRELDGLRREIEQAMGEQAAGSANVLEALGRMNALTKEIRGDSGGMAAGSQAVIAGMESLRGLTADIAGGMSEIARGAAEIDKSVRRVAELSERNRDHIGRVQAEAGKFKGCGEEGAAAACAQEA